MRHVTFFADRAPGRSISGPAIFHDLSDVNPIEIIPRYGGAD
jgi:hypothetical protein